MSKHSEHDVAFIQALAGILRESDLTEIEVEREHGESDQLKVRLTRAVAQSAPASVAAPVIEVAPVTPPARGASEVEPPAGPDLSKAVLSPMVGTVFLAPDPDAAPFVVPGDMVREGQPIMIIEAMKTMNQIPAPRAGRVGAILVENAEPVEFGEPLIIIE